MPRRKQAKRISMKDIRSILRLTLEQGLSVREVSERLRIGKTAVSTYLHRARQAGICLWPVPAAYDDDRQLEKLLFKQAGRPPQDMQEPDFSYVSRELKRKGVTLTLLWQEYRAVHPDGYGYTWFCTNFAAYEQKQSPTYRNRHEAGATMQTDYAGHTVPLINPKTGEIRQAQIFVAVLPASNLTFSYASLSQKLPDWIEGQKRALNYFGGVTKAIVCDNLKSGVAVALWFEPTITATFEAFSEHYGTTILPTRVRKPRDKAKIEGTVLIAERWILARLRNQTFFSLEDLNTAIAGLLEDLNGRVMRHYDKTRRQLFDEIEREALRPLPATDFEYAEWKSAKVHPDYHIEVAKTFYSVPHQLIGKMVTVRLTHRMVEIFFNHKRVASHRRRSERNGHVTVKEHMPKSHQRHAGMSAASLIRQANGISTNTGIFVERVIRDKPHPEQGYRAALGILSLARRYEHDRLDAACERALVINALTYTSVRSILQSGLDRAGTVMETGKPLPTHSNIRGRGYYH